MVEDNRHLKKPLGAGYQKEDGGGSHQKDTRTRMSEGRGYQMIEATTGWRILEGGRCQKVGIPEVGGC